MVSLKCLMQLIYQDNQQCSRTDVSEVEGRVQRCQGVTCVPTGPAGSSGANTTKGAEENDHCWT